MGGPANQPGAASKTVVPPIQTMSNISPLPPPGRGQLFGTPRQPPHFHERGATLCVQPHRQIRPPGVPIADDRGIAVPQRAAQRRGGGQNRPHCVARNVRAGAPLPRLEMRLVCGGARTSRQSNHLLFPWPCRCTFGPPGRPISAPIQHTNSLFPHVQGVHLPSLEYPCQPKIQTHQPAPAHCSAYSAHVAHTITTVPYPVSLIPYNRTVIRVALFRSTSPRSTATGRGSSTQWAWTSSACL